MKLKQATAKTHYLYETGVENIYINEYMVTAPGDYVKVYLMALMYLQMHREISDEELAGLLMLEEYEVKKAWDYWISLGLVKRTGKDKKTLEFMNLREMLYGDGSKQDDDSADKQGPMSDKIIKDMFKSVEKAVARPLGNSEIMEINSWLDDFDITPEMVVYAYTYCCGTLKKDNVKYIAKVVKEWATKGLTDVAALDEYLADMDKRAFLYRRIFKALGFMRNPTEEEKRIMRAWFDELDLSIDKILEACAKTAGITNPNIKYIDKVLRDPSKGNSAVAAGNGEISPGTVFKYYDYLRQKSERETKDRRNRIYKSLPQIAKIEKEIREKNTKLSRLMVSGAVDKSELIRSTHDEIENLVATKAATLTDNGYPADYMEVKYICMICKDTGITENGERCACFAERTEEAKAWQNSQKIKTK